MTNVANEGFLLLKNYTSKPKTLKIKVNMTKNVYIHS